jgi:hypothetical protein
VHQLQGKTETVNREELRQLLVDFTAGRLALIRRHEAAARMVSHYDFNNTYQYVINREETHLTWLQTALAGFGVGLPSSAGELAVPAVSRGQNKTSDFREILQDDVRRLGEFVEKWRTPVNAMTHARHRTMLNVILGESLEHRRFFEQAAAGIEDLLGRRTGGVPRVGGVLPTRWVE